MRSRYLNRNCNLSRSDWKTCLPQAEHPLRRYQWISDTIRGGGNMFKKQPYKLRALREWNIRMSRFETPEIFDSVVAKVLRDQGFSPDEVEPEPRSVYSVEKLYKQLEAYDPSSAVRVDINDSHVQRGIRFAYKLFAKPKNHEYLTTLNYYDESIISNWKASAGLTAFGEDKRSAFQRGILSAERIMRRERKPEPCVALTRTQKKGKTRLVWGYPMSMTLLEGVFAKPLLSELKGGLTPMAFAMTNKNLGSRILSAQQNSKYWFSLDMSQFDSSIQKEVIQSCFTIIRTWFDCRQEYFEGLSAGDLLRIIENYFIKTPIVMPAGMDATSEGVLYLGKDKGVPSGSYFTQLVDSISNVIMLGAFASKFGFRVNAEEIFVLGDDLLFFGNSHIDVEAVAKYGHETFGMCINPVKSKHGKADEAIPFLGRDWCRGVPQRDTTAAVQKMLYPENFRRYKGDLRKEARLVVLSYNFSAIQDVKLIPELDGWRSYWNSSVDVLNQAAKLSGLFRYMLTYTEYKEQFRQNRGSINMLNVLG